MLEIGDVLYVYNTNEFDSFSIDEANIMPILVDIAMSNRIAEYLELNAGYLPSMSVFDKAYQLYLDNMN